jgi:glycosyltransferase involved in cell wall biosynthesis
VRVCVDGRSLLGGSQRGVGHYTSAVLDALRRDFPQDDLVPVVPRSRLDSRLRFGAAALAGRPRLDARAPGCDVVWAPAPAPLAISPGVPLVLTVHDRSWELRPGDFTRYERLWHALARPRRLARRAARVLVSTEHGRADLIAAWGLEPQRVVVAPPGLRALGGVPAGESEPYLLFVGALEPRKAPDVLAAAYARARERGLRARLVAVGEGRMALPGAERLGRVDDARLGALYAGALALVVPSHLEGFGSPAIEALAHGTPVVVTDLAPVREVLGDAPFAYVPPGDPAALAAALLAVERAAPRTDPAAVAHLRWERTAEILHAALAAAAA